VRRITLIAAVIAGLVSFVGTGGVANAGVLIQISKASQRMIVTVDGRQRYVWPVSTGGFGYATPSGSYTPFRMEKTHFSTEWDDAPMPHSIFFTTRGHAIHGSYHTRRLGSAVSHGCVRLAPGNAAALYAIVTAEGMANTRVVVTGGGVNVGSMLPTGQLKTKLKLNNKLKLPKVSTTRFGDWLDTKTRKKR
jgi:hypothetical protein